MIKTRAIEPDSLIDIKVSGYFYGRLQVLLIWLASHYEEKDFIKHMQIIKDKEVDLKTHPEAYNLETVLSIINELEVSAKDQDKVKEVEIPEEGASPT